MSNIKKGLKKVLGIQNRTFGYYTDYGRLKDCIQSLKIVPLPIELVRIGPPNDGGYLVPNDLENIEACFSPGVSTEAGFEQQCASEFGMKLFLADYSVKKAPDLSVKHDFLKRYLGLWSDNTLISWQDWFRHADINENSDLLLQMDIEGDEYYSLLNLPMDYQRRFRIVVIEFHNLGKLFNPEFFQLAEKVFQKLLKTHVPVHIHPNNWAPPVQYKDVLISAGMEFTFYRRDRLEQFKGVNEEISVEIPHRLDAPNLPSRPDFVLPEMWWK